MTDRFPSFMTDAAKNVLKKRYLLEGETWGDLCRRVANHVAYSSYEVTPDEGSDFFYEMMFNLYFLPGSPCLKHAGASKASLFNCFVLGPINDNLNSIFNILKDAAVVNSFGGGSGFSFSRLRPKGARISDRGKSGGPLGFMRIFDLAIGDVIRQGGMRSSALIGLLDWKHDDIINFINAKDAENRILRNFNISVTVDKEFFSNYDVEGSKANLVWEHICEHAHKTGDPGLVFMERIREKDTKIVSEIEGVNPCNELPLEYGEACNLGAINLYKIYKDYKDNFWDKLASVTQNAVRFLDNMIDVNYFPLEYIKKKSLENRRIGLGIMGFADFLIEQNIKYDSEEGLAMAEKLMSFIRNHAYQTSEELGRERGNFPMFDKTKHVFNKEFMRNITCLTQQPTGTLSMIAGVSPGLEPNFFKKWWRKDETSDERYLMEHPLADREAFRTALEISPEWHVKMQAAFQKYIDSSISKTVNLPNSATVDDIKKTYKLAYDLGCKGITIYRDKSKVEQVINKA